MLTNKILNSNEQNELLAYTSLWLNIKMLSVKKSPRSIQCDSSIQSAKSRKKIKQHIMLEYVHMW